MKKIFFSILVVIIIPFSAFSQQKNITEAVFLYEETNSIKNPGENASEAELKTYENEVITKLTGSKEYIDLASNSESTSNHPKMWVYRGVIYLKIAQTQQKIGVIIDQDAIFKATESFLRCTEKDEEGEISVIKKIRRKYYAEEQVFEALVRCGFVLFNTAADEYSAGNYKKALKLYNNIFPIIDVDKEGLLKANNISKLSITSNSVLVAQAMKDNDLSKKLLLTLLNDSGNADPMPYVRMSKILLEEGDNNGALKYLSEAREKFPDDESSRIAEINLYIQLGRTDELIKKITAAIDSDPNNDVFYAIRANCYQSSNMLQEAISDYNNALKINPENTDVLNNISSCYLIQTEPIIKKMNALNINQTSKYKAYKKQVNDLYKQALPHLQKYVELKPEDEVNKKVLKEISYKLKN